MNTRNAETLGTVHTHTHTHTIMSTRQDIWWTVWRELILEDRKMIESLKVKREGLNLVKQKLYIKYEKMKANINLKKWNKTHTKFN